MAKRPNVRRPPERNEALEQWGREITGRSIADSLKEESAADRLEQQSYPTNNFAVTAIILVGLIVVIGLAVAFGVVK
jgi:hypothetical protein